MNTRDIAAEYRLQYWARIIHECKESGLSVKAYCESVGLHPNRYYYWQKKLREALCTELAEPTGLIAQGATGMTSTQGGSMAYVGRPATMWADVKLRDSDNNSLADRCGIKIKRDGWTVAVEPGFDAGTLTDVLKAVSRACC